MAIPVIFFFVFLPSNAKLSPLEFHSLYLVHSLTLFCYIHQNLASICMVLFLIQLCHNPCCISSVSRHFYILQYYPSIWQMVLYDFLLIKKGTLLCSRDFVYYMYISTYIKIIACLLNITFW